MQLFQQNQLGFPSQTSTPIFQPHQLVSHSLNKTNIKTTISATQLQPQYFNHTSSYTIAKIKFHYIYHISHTIETSLIILTTPACRQQVKSNKHYIFYFSHANFNPNISTTPVCIPQVELKHKYFYYFSHTNFNPNISTTPTCTPQLNKSGKYYIYYFSDNTFNPNISTTYACISQLKPDKHYVHYFSHINFNPNISTI